MCEAVTTAMVGSEVLGATAGSEALGLAATTGYSTAGLIGSGGAIGAGGTLFTSGALNTASAIASGLGSVTSALGMYQNTVAANAAAKAQAEVARRNSALANMQADSIQQAGDLAEKQYRLKIGKLMGSQRAAFGASGADVTDGSAMDVLGDTAAQGELDALTMRYNTGVKVWAARNQANDYMTQSYLDESRVTSPYMSAGGTLLTGLGSAASSWYRGKSGGGTVGYNLGG